MAGFRDGLRRRAAVLAAAVLLVGGACGIGSAARAAEPERGALRRLTGEASQLRGLYGATLAAGLREDGRAITGRELEIMRRLSRSPGVASVVYLDRDGTVRWCEDSQLPGVTSADYQRATGVSLPSASEVMASTAPRVRRVPETPVYEAAQKAHATSVRI